jgi:hypothetical protein
MYCNLCNKLLTTDTIKYKCGHMFHKYCLLSKSMSILNPECKVCNNGKMEGYSSDKEKDDDEYDDDEDDNNNKYKIFDEEELNKHEKIILCECVLLGLSLIGVITGLIYR